MYKLYKSIIATISEANIAFHRICGPPPDLTHQGLHKYRGPRKGFVDHKTDHLADHHKPYISKDSGTLRTTSRTTSRTVLKEI